MMACELNGASIVTNNIVHHAEPWLCLYIGLFHFISIHPPLRKYNKLVFRGDNAICL